MVQTELSDSKFEDVNFDNPVGIIQNLTLKQILSQWQIWDFPDEGRQPLSLCKTLLFGKILAKTA